VRSLNPRLQTFRAWLGDHKEQLRPPDNAVTPVSFERHQQLIHTVEIDTIVI
jgi:hypothetical protein